MRGTVYNGRRWLPPWWRRRLAAAGFLLAATSAAALVCGLAGGHMLLDLLDW